MALGGRAKLGAKVSRYAHLTRESGLQTALAYVAAFQEAVTHLFLVLYQQVVAEVRTHNVKLSKRLKHNGANQIGARKLESLEAIPEAEVCQWPNRP